MSEHLAPSIYPVLRYPDPAAAIQFLVDAFGFSEHAVHKGPDGQIVHAELSFDNGMVMLEQHMPAIVQWFIDHPPGHPVT